MMDASQAKPLAVQMQVTYVRPFLVDAHQAFEWLVALNKWPGIAMLLIRPREVLTFFILLAVAIRKIT